MPDIPGKQPEKGKAGPAFLRQGQFPPSAADRGKERMQLHKMRRTHAIPADQRLLLYERGVRNLPSSFTRISPVSRYRVRCDRFSGFLSVPAFRQDNARTIRGYRHSPSPRTVSCSPLPAGTTVVPFTRTPVSTYPTSAVQPGSRGTCGPPWTFPAAREPAHSPGRKAWL